MFRIRSSVGSPILFSWKTIQQTFRYSTLTSARPGQGRATSINRQALSRGESTTFDWHLDHPVSTLVTQRTHRIRTRRRSIRDSTISGEAGLPIPRSELSGVLSGDLTLTPEGSPYRVIEDLIVPDGVTLTVLPGTTVYFDAGTELTVNGRI